MSTRWQRFYAAAGTAPRETLLDALARFDDEERAPGVAVDLGSGAGRDTLELLRRGWRVVAVDAEPAAMELLRAAAGDADGLETVEARFADAEWQEADLINSSFALPFCPPDEFVSIWSHVVESLRPGGRFCGQLFGERDEWAPSDDLNFHSRAEVEELLAGFDLERLDEVDEDGRTAVGEPKHWHLFHVVARKP